MKEEFDSLMENVTWEYHELPNGRKTIKNKCVYKLKLAADGSVDCYKARLVAKGFTQKEGIDFKETYSPVIKFDSIWTILSIATAKDMNITQFDVRTTFLYREIEEEIYMTQPLGFEYRDHLGQVCRLRKSLRTLSAVSGVES